MKAIVGTIVILTLIVSFSLLFFRDSENISSLLFVFSVIAGSLVGLSVVGAFLYDYNKPVPDAFPKFAFITVLFIIPGGFCASALHLLVSSSINLNTIIAVILFLLIALEICLRGFYIAREYAARNAIIRREATEVLFAGFVAVAMPMSVLATRL